MDNFTSVLESYRESIRYWWVSLLLGIIVFIMGIVVFMHPGESYVALAIVFGLMILLSGILQLFLGVNMPRKTGKGWIIASGAIEIILGIVLTFNLGISAIVLPFFLGFWLLFRGMVTIGIASDMRHNGIQGTGWTIFWAILLMLSAFAVLIFPAIGVGAIVIWLGISLLMAGLVLVFFAFQLHSQRKYIDNPL